MQEDHNNFLEVFDINTLAKYLNCSAQLIRRYVAEQKIPHFKMGKKYLFRKIKIDEWLEEQENKYKIELRKKDMQETIKRIKQI